MKKLAILSLALVALSACCKQEQTFDYTVDKFYDLEILRYQVPEFDSLSLQQKTLVYHLTEAALHGRDILFDQNGRYNLRIRRALEALYTQYKGDKKSEEFVNFEKYLKRVWFANGIHHHYASDKFQPEFSQEWFVAACAEAGVTYDEAILPVIFDPTVMPKRLSLEGEDLLLASANNYYEGVTQAEAEAYYEKHKDTSAEPLWIGLNSKLVKENGKVVERTYKVGGMYSAALEKVVEHLEKALPYAENEQQRLVIEKMIEFNKTGDLKAFNEYCIAWVKDLDSRVDYVNGFTETYADPLGITGTWESLVNFKDMRATHRCQTISDNAQWFEDNSPTDKKYKKEEVKGVSAKVITAAILAGDCYPATPIGINLPNADWIRKEYGSKSVTIDNITYAYDKAAQGNGFNEEFMLREEDRARIAEYGKLGDDLHTDLHECLGHGSGQLAPGVKGGELKSYTSTLEETRADLFGLYYLGDPKMVEIGLIPSLDVAKAQYADYIMNGMMTQFARIELGKNVEESHMRNRKLIAEWCYEKGKENNVIEWVKQDGKSYIVVNDFDALRSLFGELLKEVQRIKSTGDYEAGRKLVEDYAVKIDYDLHKEVLERYGKLGIEPYSGFVNPDYELVEKDGEIVDVKLVYKTDYVEQMLHYSKEWSFLPSIN